MKKVFLVFILLLTGCKSKYITCKIDIDNKVENYKQESVYKIYYKNNYATKIEKEDVYKSDEEDKIKYLKEINELLLNNYESGFTYDIADTKNKLTINTNIDVNKLDLKKLVLEGKIDKDYVHSNKLTKTGLINLYESKGAKCDI